MILITTQYFLCLFLRMAMCDSLRKANSYIPMRTLKAPDTHTRQQVYVNQWSYVEQWKKHGTLLSLLFYSSGLPCEDHPIRTSSKQRLPQTDSSLSTHGDIVVTCSLVRPPQHTFPLKAFQGFMGRDFPSMIEGHDKILRFGLIRSPGHVAYPSLWIIVLQHELYRRFKKEMAVEVSVAITCCLEVEPCKANLYFLQSIESSLPFCASCAMNFASSSGLKRDLPDMASVNISNFPSRVLFREDVHCFCCENGGVIPSSLQDLQGWQPIPWSSAKNDWVHDGIQILTVQSFETLANSCPSLGQGAACLISGAWCMLVLVIFSGTMSRVDS